MCRISRSMAAARAAVPGQGLTNRMAWRNTTHGAHAGNGASSQSAFACGRVEMTTSLITWNVDWRWRRAAGGRCWVLPQQHQPGTRRDWATRRFSVKPWSLARQHSRKALQFQFSVAVAGFQAIMPWHLQFHGTFCLARVLNGISICRHSCRAGGASTTRLTQYSCQK